MKFRIKPKDRIIVRSPIGPLSGTVATVSSRDDHAYVRLFADAGFIYTACLHQQEILAHHPTPPDLQTIWATTAEFHRRFHGDAPALVDAGPYIEKADEFLDAIQNATPDYAAEEFADLMLTAIGCLMARGISLNDIYSAIEHVNEKKLCADDKIARRPGDEG